MKPSICFMVQVVNRDLSIAILRQFIKLRKAELAEGKLKLKSHRKGAPRPSGNGAAEAPTDPSKVRILEGLAASGLRAIRYALEVRVQPRRDNQTEGPNAWATASCCRYHTILICF